MPVVGIVVGAGVNAKTTNGVAEAAGNLYRERSLCEKYGMPEPTARAPATTVDEDSVDVADVREAEILVDGRESA